MTGSTRDPPVATAPVPDTRGRGAQPLERMMRVMRTSSPSLVLVTAGSLAGSMVMGSLLGAAFWWVATQLFDPSTVGVAVGWLAAMSLVASLSFVGAGTLLVRDLHRASAPRVALIGTAVLSSGAVALVIGAVFAIAAPMLAGDLGPLNQDAFIVALFAVGVALTTVATVVDEVLLGLLRARLRLARNVVFNVAKIALLALVGVVVAIEDPLYVYAAWVGGVVVSMILLVPFLSRFWAERPFYSTRLLRQMAPGALSHQGLNFLMALPALGIPLAAALILAPTATAQFYIAFMLASVSFYAPFALSQTLYAVGSRSLDRVWEHAQLTAGLSLACGIASVVGLALLAEPILSLFGPQYVPVAPVVPLLAAVSIPLIVKDHYAVVFRIRHREIAALVLCSIGAALELGGAVAGLTAAGSTGLAVGWLVAVTIEAVVMGPPLIRALRSGGGDAESPEPRRAGAETGDMARDSG